MGAINFECIAYGMNEKEAYKNAVEEATNEYGNNPYNGTINTAHRYRDITNAYRNSGKSMNEYIRETLDNASKLDCFIICLESPKENKNKVKTKVENIVSRGTKRWLLQYVVYNVYGDKVKTASTKTEAVAWARNYVEKIHIATLSIKMEKVLENPNAATVAKISYKTNGKERKGKYLFFGIAAY
jgi:hypothetical protein